MGNALHKQVGGTHYSRHKWQPIQLFEVYCILQDVSLANIIKYVTRCFDKNGAQDIDKALQYLHFIKMSKNGEVQQENLYTLHQFIKENGLTENQEAALTAAFQYTVFGGDEEYEEAMSALMHLREDMKEGGE